MFLTGAKRRGFDVLVHPLDHTQSVADINRQIGAHREEIKDGTACSMDEFGQTHPTNVRCDNELWDELEGTSYCPVLKITELRARQRRLECAEQMLNFYWGTASNTDCLDFLQASGLIYSYR